MKLENYYLNLDKINSIEKLEERNRIHEMYREMLYAENDNRKKMAESFFLTLYNNGFLINSREEKIDDILNEDNSIGS